MAVVGVAEFEIVLPGCSSLKDKRRVVQSLIQKIRNRYNVSIREVDHLDRRQRATIAAAKVLGKVGEAEELAVAIERQIEGFPQAEMLRREVHVVGPE
ncbi:MAG: DUF503 domain-containing protein [Terriglobia bacterium]